MKRLRRSVSLPLAAVLGALGLILAAPAPGQAHWADLAVAEIDVGDSSARVALAFPTGLVAQFDDNHDGELSADEIRAHQAALETLLSEKIRLADGGHAGMLTVEPVASPAQFKNLNSAPGTHSTLLLVYTWPRPVSALTIRYDLFAPGVSTASCLATILQRRQVRSFVFTPEHRDVSLSPGGTVAWAQARGFVALGIEHILTGYDHILFLLSLLMLGGGLRYLLKVVSAFTVAHSITLSLAVLSIVTLPSRWVESAIALSIIYVAGENFWRKDRALRSRWLVTFGFGLVHGLGFASILREFAIPRSSLALSLASFNIGVEMGQVAIVTAAYLLLQVVQAQPWEVALRRLVSAGAVAAGLIWFVQRAVMPF